MDHQKLLILVVLASAAWCINVVVTGPSSAGERPTWPVALAAYSGWVLASAALAVLLQRRRTT
jgi:hypothetical protein